ncbi:hypothetical protein L596_006005 [Steinernema carpocapsae]|uniref:Uncharacterized protein n=1 Tax=Steinernema carpocapsae TaxID=34508 RepID=A0A4U8V124_STECR|nr:hypothetical protein L596_006005 [Steinernema carpocapsae]
MTGAGDSPFPTAQRQAFFYNIHYRRYHMEVPPRSRKPPPPPPTSSYDKSLYPPQAPTEEQNDSRNRRAERREEKRQARQQGAPSPEPLNTSPASSPAADTGTQPASPPPTLSHLAAEESVSHSFNNTFGFLDTTGDPTLRIDSSTTVKV